MNDKSLKMSYFNVEFDEESKKTNDCKIGLIVYEIVYFYGQMWEGKCINKKKVDEP